jgi:hypothetical protein
MTFRSLLYTTSRVLGDLHAVEHHRVPQRIARRIVYKHAFRTAGWLCRLLKVAR